MRVAAIDLGTNTFILLIADVERGRVTKVHHDEVRIVRLGQGVHESKRLHPEALRRADECLGHFSRVIRQHKVHRVLACATSAARDVANGSELVEIAAQHEIPVEIISGEKEAELTFSGTVSDSDQGPVLIIDIGGGSTEFIFGDESGLKARKSIDIGAVRLTEAFVTQHPIPVDEMMKMTSYIQEKIRGIRDHFPSEPLKVVSVAGTPTTLATLDQGLAFESERVHGYHLSLSQVRHWVKRLAELTVEERQVLAGMEPKRADVIVAGALILMLAGQSFQACEMEVSIRGLRYGLAKELGTK